MTKKNFTNKNKEKAYRYFEEMCNKGVCPTISKTRTGWVVYF